MDSGSHPAKEQDLRILYLEDNPHDAELVLDKLANDGIRCDANIVGSRNSFETALGAGQFDLIICDYNLPSYDGNSALTHALRKKPEVPFIFVSGTIGEDRAIEALKNGATDYVLKDKLERVVPAVRRALREVEERKARHDLEEQLIRAQRMESIGILAGGIAHDLNNVLGPIVMGIDVLRQSINDPKDLRMLDTMGQSAERGAAILKQVLRIARGEEGEKKLVKPRQVIDEVLRLIKETFPRTIKIVDEIEEPVSSVKADPNQLHQVLLNICLNARDAMSEYGKLTIGFRETQFRDDVVSEQGGAKPGSYVTISVSDTGSGMSSEVRSRIFDPFFTTKEPGKGTGLGLSTVNAIIKGHGGFISVDSEPGRGSTFKVNLPVAPSAGGQTEHQKAIGEIPKGDGELVLVVDDEISIREVTREMLETHGYRVVAAGDGAEALAIQSREKGAIKLVIMDLMMPVLGGADTIRTLRVLEPDLKIIAVSGMPLAGQSGSVAEENVVALLSKPYSSSLILSAIAKALGKLK